MSRLQFRNVDASPGDPVTTWPYEALVTAIERGLVEDWQPIFAEIRRSPWGVLARRVERLLAYRVPDGVSTLFRLAIDRSRKAAERSEREEVGARVRRAVERSGLRRAVFAAQIGTSASRLSTYLSATVIPSASLLIRMERLAASPSEDPGTARTTVTSRTSNLSVAAPRAGPRRGPRGGAGSR